MSDQRLIGEPAVVPQTAVYGDSPGRHAIEIVLRVIGVIAGAVPLVVGLIAVAKVNWSANGFSAPPVRVWGMVLSPWVAVATAIAGLILLAAAATPFRGDKLVAGVLSAAGGFAILVATPTVDHVILGHRYGTMFLVVGIVQIVIGLLMGFVWSRDRVAVA